MLLQKLKKKKKRERKEDGRETEEERDGKTIMVLELYLKSH